MDKKTKEEVQALVDKATSGDKKALETLVTDVQDMIFNLSLRMLGTFADAEDATQDILLKMITHLSSFRGESRFTTWAYRHLLRAHQRKCDGERFPRGKQVHNMGIPDCCESSEKLQEAYVCPCSVKL